MDGTTAYLALEYVPSGIQTAIDFGRVGVSVLIEWVSESRYYYNTVSQTSCCPIDVIERIME